MSFPFQTQSNNNLQNTKELSNKSSFQLKNHPIHKFKWRKKKIANRKLSAMSQLSFNAASAQQQTSFLMTESSKNILEPYKIQVGISQKQDSHSIIEQKPYEKNQEFFEPQSEQEVSNSDIPNEKQMLTNIKPYVSNIINHMLSAEIKFIPQQILNQGQIFLSDRFKAINSLKQITNSLKFKFETSLLAVNIIDRMLGKLYISLQKISYLAFTALWISIKYEETKYPTLQKFLNLYRFDHQFLQKSQVIEIQGEILRVLNYQLYFVSPIKFIEIFLIQQSLNENIQQVSINYLKEVFSYGSIRFYNSSIIALSCINLALQQKLDQHNLKEEQKKEIAKCCYDIKHIYFIQKKPFPKTN